MNESSSSWFTLRRRLRYIVAGGVGVVVLSLFVAPLWLGNARPQGPVLFVETRNYNAGTVSSTAPAVIRHRFLVRNDGAQSLTISDMKTSCGCAVVNRRQRVIPPGQEEYIEVELNLADMGPRSSDVIIVSDAPSSPDRLRIEATLVPEAAGKVAPLELRFDGVVADAPATKYLSVLALSVNPGPIGVTVMTRSGQVEAKVAKSLESRVGNQFGYFRTQHIVAVTPHVPDAGEFSDRVTVMFDSPAIAPVSVPVSGYVLPKWVLRPDHVFFVMTRRDAAAPIKRVLLRHSGGVPVRLVSVDNPLHRWIEVEAETMPETRQVRLTLRLVEGAEEDRIDGQVGLALDTGEDALERVSVPVSIRYIDTLEDSDRRTTH